MAAVGKQLLRWVLDALIGRLKSAEDGGDREAAAAEGGAKASAEAGASSLQSPKKGAVERPESEAARLALQNAAASLPSLLAWGRYREAHEELTMVRRMGDQISDLLQVEPEDLRSLLLTPLALLPQLPAESSEQTLLAFDATTLSAWLAAEAVKQNSLWDRFKPLLKELIAAMSAAWFFTPGLAAQVLDNNRFVLRFAAVLLDAPDPDIDHEVLLSLAFCCINAPDSDKSIMASRYFSIDVIWAFADTAPPPEKSFFGSYLPSSSSSSSSSAVPSAAAKPSSSSDPFSAPHTLPLPIVASRAASEALAYKLLLECKAPLHSEPGRLALNAALTLVTAWESKFEGDQAVADVWVSAILALLPQIYPGSDACLPAAILAAFFLPRSSWLRTKRLGSKTDDGVVSWELQPLWQWFQNLLRQPHSNTRPELVLRGYVASALGPRLIAAASASASPASSTSPSSSWSSASPVVLARLREELSLRVIDASATLVCNVVLPITIFEMSTMELQQHFYSPESQCVVAAASCLARSLHLLSEKERVARFIDPLTALCQRWADRWDCLGPAQGMRQVTGQAAGILHRFGTTLMLFVASILREVPEWSLFSQRELLQLMKCLASIDHFREVADAEHTALCTQIAEMGAKDPGFVTALFAMLQQASKRIPAIGSGERPPQAALRSLHFLLGMVAVEDIVKSADFFRNVWPVILDAFGRSSEGPAWEQEATFLAARAHALACVAYKSSSDERPTPTKVVEDHLTAGIEALRAAPDQQATRSFAAAIAAACRDFATRRESSGLSTLDVEAAKALSDFALDRLSEAIWSCLQQHDDDGDAAAVDDAAAEGLFEVFIAVARFHDASGLTEVLYDRCRLGWMLQKHEPLRKKWLGSLIGDFAETTRLPLLRRLLDEHPEVAGALGPDPEGDGRRGALAWLGLLRAAL